MNCQGLHHLRFISIPIVLALSNWVGANEFMLPDASQQMAAWEAPATTLPPAFVEACKALFEHGVADPRGCEYREVRIRSGVTAPQGLLLKTHAFVLPGNEGDARFAIGWNGLVYPAEQVGEPVDLARDMAEVVRQVKVKKRWHQRRTAGRGEADALSAFSNQSMKSALLLRLGHTRLAEKIWEVRDQLSPCNDYRELASHYHQLALQRLNNAHRRGDDQMALVAAERLARFEMQSRRYAEQAGLPKPKEMFQGYDVTRLLADQQRRAKQRRQAKGNVRQPRITQLIADLENLTALYDPADSFSPRYSRTIRAIIERDEEAIGPLLDCVENDKRLTRDLNENIYGPAPTFREVKQVAGQLLVQLLDAKATKAWRTVRKHREADAMARIRALRGIASKTAGLSRPQRWQFYLSEDSASPQQWAEAAQRITRPADEIHDHFGWIVQPARPSGFRPVFCGESLRSATDPSITETLQARIGQLDQRLLATEDEGDTAPELGDAAVRLMHCLALWDPKAARASLKKGFATLIDPRVEKQYKRFSSSRYAEHVARVTGDRLSIDDPDALPAYLAWLTKQTPATVDSLELRAIFQPLIQFAQDDRAMKAAELMFTQEGSAWNPILQPRSISGNFHYAELMASPLFTVSALRKQLLRELDNRAPAGSLKVLSPGHAEGETPFNYSSFSSPTNAPGDARNTPVGDEIHLRVCDLYAHSLARLPGMPEFSLLWTNAHRDAAIAECRTVMARYGHLYGPIEDFSLGLFDEITPVFAPLRQAATKDDVKAARAIFTLQDLGSATCVPLKRYPLPVRRHRPGYDQPDRGLVWQCEEIKQEGTAERYYGFVGTTGMAKVPGVEIEFDTDAPVSPWSTFHAELVAVGQKHRLRPVMMVNGTPLSMQLRFHNLRGAEQSLPKEWLRRVGDAWLWREGVELRLERIVKDFPHDYLHSAFAQDIPGRPMVYFRPRADEPQQRLEPEASFTAATFDLRRWFDVTEPGSYTLQVRLPGKSGATSTIANVRFDVRM